MRPEDEITELLRFVQTKREETAPRGKRPVRTDKCLPRADLWKIALNPDEDDRLQPDDRAHLSTCAHCQHNLDFARRKMWHPSESELRDFVTGTLEDESQRQGIERHLTQLNCRGCGDKVREIKAELQSRPEPAPAASTSPPPRIAERVGQSFQHLGERLDDWAERFRRFIAPEPGYAATSKGGREQYRRSWSEDDIDYTLFELGGDLKLLAEPGRPVFEGRLVEVSFGGADEDPETPLWLIFYRDPYDEFVKAQDVICAFQEVLSISEVRLVPEDEADNPEKVPVLVRSALRSLHYNRACIPAWLKVLLKRRESHGLSEEDRKSIQDAANELERAS